MLSNIILAVVTASASQAAESPAQATITLTSSAFTNGAALPEQYTCQGKNISPPLKWSGVPSQAKSLILIMDDPDAPVGAWAHWVLYDLPPSTSELVEDFGAASGATADTGKQGVNDFKKRGYGGPCPPAGKPHRYFLKLYALNCVFKSKAWRDQERR